jgi:hypothetical protein
MNKSISFFNNYKNMWAGVAQFSIATRLWTDWTTGVRLIAGAETYLISTMSRTTLKPTHAPIQWILEAISPSFKWPRHEADHSPLYNGEVKNAWNHAYIPQYHLQRVVLRQAQE